MMKTEKSLAPFSAHLAAIGSYLPERRIDNRTLAAELGFEPSALESRIGIFQRSLAGDAETVAEMCEKAYYRLNQKRPIERSRIGLVVVVTQTPDALIPHTAAVMHERLGLGPDCMTFDVSQGCAGFVHALAIAGSLMEKLGIEAGLVFTCDPYSRIVDSQDKGTALLFGDAASATLLSLKDGVFRLVDAQFGTAPGTTKCLHRDNHLVMDGRAIVMNAAREVPKSVQSTLSRQGLEMGEVDLFLFHPGSLHVINLLRKSLGLDSEKVPFHVSEYGNTVSSSIPLMLEEVIDREDYLTVLISGFGVGFTWGTGLLQRC